MAIHQPEMIESIRTVLLKEFPRSAALVAYTRLCLAEAENVVKKDPSFFIDDAKPQTSWEAISRLLLTKLTEVVPDPALCFSTLLDAGADVNVWSDDYHGVLATAARVHLESFPDQLKVLLMSLERALDEEDWSALQIVLAMLAACAEVMPTALQNAARGKLETLLVRGAMNARSINSRRYALAAMSFLRVVTPAVIPALLIACRDVAEVQRDAITAVSRFQSIEGDLLPDFIQALFGESMSTAYTVTHLLATLGTSTASEAVHLQGQIIEALVKVLKHPNSQRVVIIAGENRGKLEDALYTALLQVTGWIG